MLGQLRYYSLAEHLQSINGEMIQAEMKYNESISKHLVECVAKSPRDLPKAMRDVLAWDV